jgi:HTH-type transcriptional regulator/antitoxin HigA
MTDTTRFECDWVSPPGDTIADALEERGMTQIEFAERTGFSKKHVNGLIEGSVAITAETALKLESLLGSTASFWLGRELEYQEDLARKKRLEEAAEHADWLK